jgi:hypothetical protein
VDQRHRSRGPQVETATYLEWVTTIAGATTLVGALLFYFGWARASATFSYLGIEADVLGLGFQEYLLRSVRSTYSPLLALVVFLLGGLALRRFLVGSPVAFPVGIALITFGSISALFGLFVSQGLVTVDFRWPLVPVAYLVAAILAVYGFGLLLVAWDQAPKSLVGSIVIHHPLVGGVILLLAFWVVSSYAGYRGKAIGEEISAHPDSRPSVVVLSENDLHLRGSGVRTERVEGEGSAFAYCYSGLRFLIRSGDRQFLLPERWKRGRDPVIVLPESQSIRFEYFPSQAVSNCR